MPDSEWKGHPPMYSPEYIVSPSNQILSDKRYKELVDEGMIKDDKVHDRQKIASDGLSTDYYTLPEHAKELRHLMSHKGMSASRANIFKACYRLGEKEGVDVLYDLNKMKFFIEDLIEMHSRGEKL